MDSENHEQSENVFARDKAAVGIGRPIGSHRRRRPRPPKLYRIGEVVDYAGLSRQTIHNYTTMGLIRESNWTQGGHRLYDESVFDRLETIARLKSEKRSMDFIRRHFARAEEYKDG
jgi:hypothetical protein